MLFQVQKGMCGNTRKSISSRSTSTWHISVTSLFTLAKNNKSEYFPDKNLVKPSLTIVSIKTCSNQLCLETKKKKEGGRETRMQFVCFCFIYGISNPLFTKQSSGQGRTNYVQLKQLDQNNIIDTLVQWLTICFQGDGTLPLLRHFLIRYC